MSEWINLKDRLPGLSIERWGDMGWRKSKPLLMLTKWGEIDFGELREYPFGLHWTGRFGLRSMIRWQCAPDAPQEQDKPNE